MTSHRSKKPKHSRKESFGSYLPKPGASLKLGIQGLIISTHPEKTSALNSEGALFNLVPPPIGRLQI